MKKKNKEKGKEKESEQVVTRISFVEWLTGQNITSTNKCCIVFVGVTFTYCKCRKKVGDLLR